MTEDITIVQDIRGDALARCVEWIEQRDGFIATAAELVAVGSDADLDEAGLLLAAMKKHAKALGAERTAVTRPLDEVKRQIMDQAKAMVADLEAETARIKRLCDAYATRKAREAEAARIEAQRQAAEDAARREAAASVFGESAVIQTPAPAVPAVPPPAAPKAAGSRIVTRWEFEVTDAAMVPREFCVPDPRAIRAWMDYQVKTGRNPEMPGVRFASRQSVESMGR